MPKLDEDRFLYAKLENDTSHAPAPPAPLGPGVLPWIAVPPIEADAFREIRLQTIFEYHKWDPQVGDVSTLADVPILLRRGDWDEIARAAERLAAESIAVEREVLSKPSLWKRLGLTRAVRDLWRDGSDADYHPVRVIRFDFHFADGRWLVSEGNTDVPGGYNEGSGFTRLVGELYPAAEPAGDPGSALAEAARDACGVGALIALVHASAHTEDRQVVRYLADAFEAEGLRTCLVNPAQVGWTGGRASVASDWARGPVDMVYRYFPAEWLANLPRTARWPGVSATPCCNPVSALFSQSKRLPVIWNELSTPVPEWHKRLPETVDPREAGDWTSGEWVLKPAFGRVGQDVALPGVTAVGATARMWRDALRRPENWVAQRRFIAASLDTAGTRYFPCVGVYTVNGRVAGAYGRLGATPLIDATARDAAVLVEGKETTR